jgi:hypothetical protein
MPHIDLLKVEINWLRQILEHIETAIKTETMTDYEKITAINWLVRQTQSVNRDE